MSIRSKKWIIELIGWGLSLILSFLILLPIYQAEIEFEWIKYNFFFLLASLTFVRYIFSFQYHPLGDSKIFKILLIFSAPLLFFPILEGLHSFLEFNDRIGLQSILGHMSIERQQWFIQYIRTEFILAGVTCFLGIFAVIIKMIRSLWRQYKFG